MVLFAIAFFLLLCTCVVVRFLGPKAGLCRPTDDHWLWSSWIDYLWSDYWSLHVHWHYL